MLTRFATILVLSGLLTTPALADGMSRPGDDSAQEDDSPRRGSRGRGVSASDLGEVMDVLHAIGLSSPVIESLLDGLTAADLAALVRDLRGGDIAAILGGDLGDVFGLGDDQGGGKKGKKGKKGKGGKKGKS